jgi:NADH-quinone oxidoreductase subunit L
MEIPLVVLAVFATIGGFVPLPEFLRTALPPLAEAETAHASALTLASIAGITSLVGIGIAYALYFRGRTFLNRIVTLPVGRALHEFWFRGWDFDGLYDVLIVRPYVGIARLNRADLIDMIYRLLAGLSRALFFGLRRTETGRVRWYAGALVMGAVIFIAFVVFL